MLLNKIVEVYSYVKNSGDIRSNQLPFVEDPMYVMVALLMYLGMVVYGPKLMENREPLKLRGLLIGYNFLSVLLSAYMMFEFIRCSFFNPTFTLLCNKIVEEDQSDMTLSLMYAHWLYFFSKVIEFIDTLFFVLRKKNNQISFLHVYHHSSMLVLQWLTVKYIPGGTAYFGPLCNCFIHALMYTYYMLSAVGPHMQKYLWWKKYLTRMQMIQFIIVLVHISYAINLDCGFPRQWMWLLWFYMISLFLLFSHFYHNAYRNKPKST